MRFGSTAAIVRRVRRHELREAARRDDLRLDAELPADRCDDAVHLAGEPVHDAGLEPSDRRLADHARRLDVVDLHEPRGTGEERLHRRLDPGSEHAADVLPLGRDDVEVRRRAEVDDDHRCAVAVLRGDGVDDPVRADLARVVVADRDAGLHARPDDEDRCLRPNGRRGAPTHGREPGRSTRGRCRRRRRGRACRRGSTPSSSPVRVRSVARRQSSVSSVAVVQPEHGLRVADVDREQHRDRRWSATGGRACRLASTERSLRRRAATRPCARRATGPSASARRPRRAAPRP